jgi:hypothetical protein
MKKNNNIIDFINDFPALSKNDDIIPNNYKKNNSSNWLNIVKKDSYDNSDSILFKKRNRVLKQNIQENKEDILENKEDTQENKEDTQENKKDKTIKKKNIYVEEEDGFIKIVKGSLNNNFNKKKKDIIESYVLSITEI